jgi:hypothetical protein
VGNDGESITRGAGVFTDAVVEIGETPFRGKSGELMIIEGMITRPGGGGKSGESTIIEGNAGV